MQFNEFNRRLENANADPQTKYLLGYLFEVAQEHDRNIQVDRTGLESYK